MESMKAGVKPPIDVYDAAAWMAVTCLSEQSVAMGGAPVPVPDFTDGKWIRREKDAPPSTPWTRCTICKVDTAKPPESRMAFRRFFCSHPQATGSPTIPRQSAAPQVRLHPHPQLALGWEPPGRRNRFQRRPIGIRYVHIISYSLPTHIQCSD